MGREVEDEGEEREREEVEKEEYEKSERGLGVRKRSGMRNDSGGLIPPPPSFPFPLP